MYFSGEYKKLLKEVPLWHFRNVNVTNEGVVFKGFNVFHQSLNKNEYNSPYKIGKYLLGKYVKYSKIKLNPDEKYLLAHDSWSNGYFHWMCDVLQKLYLTKELLNKHVLLLPARLDHTFIRASLQLLGIKKIFLLPANAYATVPHLTACPPAAPSGNYNEDIIQSIRKDLLNSVLPVNTIFTERIYISRSKAQRRKILNESEVISLLEKYRFKKVHFEDYTMSEQINIARNSKYMVGLHGAGLTNVLFMPPKSSLLELKAENDSTNHCFFSLASAVGVDYHYLFCKRENTMETVQDGNIFVNIESLEKELRFMLFEK